MEAEPIMSPEIHERIAVAESNIKTTQADVAKILDLVEKMPGRLTKRMKRLLQECRDNQTKTYGPRKPEQAYQTQVQVVERDWTQVVRAVVIAAGIVGGLIAGAYQGLSASEPKTPPAIVAPK